MVRTLPDDQVRLLRTRAQRLSTGRSAAATSAAQVVRGVCGIQAQDVGAALLGVRARSSGLVAADVERALAEERSIVRTWCMRGTLHLVAAEDMGWLLDLLGPTFARASRGRRKALGLDDETAARAVDALRDVLGEHGPLTRAEIVDHLARRGFQLTGQARPHLLRLAALQGVVCHGPTRGREPTYLLLTDWVAPEGWLRPEAPGAELARRYLAAYAPATPEDLAAWSGLSLTAARGAWRQIKGQLVEVAVEGTSAWMLEAQAPWLDEDLMRPAVRLLPRYDTYLLGYRSRNMALPPPYARRIFPGGGLLHPALIVDGRVIGGWKAGRRAGRMDLELDLFEVMPDYARPALDAEVDDLGRFQGVEATLRVLAPR